MEIQLENYGELTVAVLRGEVDGKSAPEVQGKLLPLLDFAGQVILDMQGVTFLSSAGLRVLFLLNRSAAACSGKVYLAGLSPEIKDTMSITGFLKFFQLADSVEEAIGALS
jgi:anti-sigma B factor antagonist